MDMGINLSLGSLEIQKQRVVMDTTEITHGYGN